MAVFNVGEGSYINVYILNQIFCQQEARLAWNWDRTLTFV